MTDIRKGILRAMAAPIAGAMALVSTTTAYAQSDDYSAEEDEVEEIIVTGSRLVRRDYVAPSPITTLGRETFDFASQPTLEASLNKMPQLTPAFDRTSNNPGNGTSQINLRGMGPGRTLVMLNGRRLASSGIGSAVDANNLPNALTERVEIITGGASTVYGSDAIAGVVNVITRKDFDGLELNASAYVTEAGDSETYDVNVAFGHNFANGKGNIAFFGGFLDRSDSFQGDRTFTAQPLFENYQTGELEAGGSFATPSGVTFVFTGQPPPNDFAITTWDANGDPIPFVSPDDEYNYAPINYLQIPLERHSGGIFLNYELTSSTELYSELSFTRKKVRQNLAPVPAFSFPGIINTDNPILTPANSQFMQDNFIPAPGIIPGIANTVIGFFGRRLLELGPRIFDSEKDYGRAVVGLRGEIFADWDYDFWVTYTNGDEIELQLNGASNSRYHQGLLVDPATGQCYDPSNGCVPVNIFGPDAMSDAAVDFIRVRPIVNETQRTQKLASFFLRGELGATWAGPVRTAFGVEWREDEGGYQADDLLFAGDALGVNADAAVEGKESVTELYAETIIPLLQDSVIGEYLGLEIGGRYSDYEHAGGVESFKFGGDWQLNSTLRFRVMYQRSVRAPNLLEAFQVRRESQGSYAGFSPADDPCSALADPIGAGRVDACVATGLPANLVGTFEAIVQSPTTFISGGNPDLLPETAETFTGGVVVTPDAWPSWQFAIDYYSLDVEDQIGDINATDACFDVANVDNLFCDRITRDPNNGYNVNQVDERNINRGILATRGIDTQVQWSTDLPDALAIGNNSADLVVNLTWTRMLEQKSQATAFGTIKECVGLFGSPCGTFGVGTFPRDRVTTTFNYASGDWSMNLLWQWISSADNARPLVVDLFGAPEPLLSIPSISSRNYLDLGVGYRLSDNIIARLAIANLTDKIPPLQAGQGNINTDSAMYDVFGRAYTLSFSLTY